MKMQKNKISSYINSVKSGAGFTLIELLVVIAIIGILSAVVLASLNTARGKGADAAVKEDLHGIRSQAEIFYDNNSGSYVGVCGDANIANALSNASTTGGNPTICNDSTTQWAASATLKSAGGFWCVDYSGVAKEEPSDLGDATVCS